MIRIGVVGLGAMGQHHARLYSQLNCEFVGVSDINVERAREIGNKYNVKYYSDNLDLISKVDAVSIAVPTTAHHSVALNFLREGIHCLVEKPLAFTLHEADELINEAERNKVKLAVGHIENHNPAVTKMKEIIDAGNLGKPLVFSTRRIGPFDPRVKDVGVVIDWAPHDIGVVNYLTGMEPLSVFTQVGTVTNNKGDYAIILLNYSEAIACIELNWSTPYKVRTLVVTGSKGFAYLDYIEQRVTLHNTNINEVINIQREEPLKLELEDFLKSVVKGEKPKVDGREARAILKTAVESSHNTYNTSL